MAILCRDHKLLFIQAPRTGCTAIERLLIDRFGGASLPEQNILDADGFIRVQRKHCTIPQLQAEGLIPAQYDAELTTVTTIRNPYDSLVSLYIKKRETYQVRLADPTSWVHSIRGYVEDMEFCRTHSFEEWLVKRYEVGRLDRLLGRRRRSLYGRYTTGVRVVMRFEQLQDDFTRMMRGLGVQDDVTIPDVNATRQRTKRYQDYYTPRARQIVEYVFKPELEQYGYGFDDRSTPASSPGALESAR